MRKETMSVVSLRGFIQVQFDFSVSVKIIRALLELVRGGPDIHLSFG